MAKTESERSQGDDMGALGQVRIASDPQKAKQVVTGGSDRGGREKENGSRRS